MKKLTLLLFATLLTLSTAFANRTLSLPAHFQGVCTPNKTNCVYFSPTDLPVEAVRAYLKSARKSIRIATYNMSIADYADILMDKANRGVRIEYAVDYKLSFQNKLWPKIDGNHYLVTKYRLPVMRGGNPQMHNKLILIDEETDDPVLLTGSANYSYMGLIANYENIFATKDKKII